MAIKKCPRCGKKFVTDSFISMICPNCDFEIKNTLGMYSRYHGDVMTSFCPICGEDKEPWKFKEWWDESKNDNNKVRKFLKRSGNKHGLKRGTKICEDCYNKIDKLYYDW